MEEGEWDEENGRCVGDTCTVTIYVPPQPIWSEKKVINGTRGIIDIANPHTSKLDSCFHCVLADLAIKEDHFITRAEPLIDTFPDPFRPGEIFDTVHHVSPRAITHSERERERERERETSCAKSVCPDKWLTFCVHFFLQEDLFLCKTSIWSQTKVNMSNNEDCSINSHVSGGSCIFSVVYDKGEGAFDFPDDIGIKVGPGATYGQMFLQVHYLPPKHILEAEYGVWDRSGYRFTLEKANKSKRESLGVAAMITMSNLYPPYEVPLHFKYDMPAVQISSVLAQEIQKFGSIQPVAIHLHGHSRLKQIWVDHLRGKKGSFVKLGEYGRIDEYHGHGKDQEWLVVPEADRQRPFLPGDTFRVHCIVHTMDMPPVKDGGLNIPYGVQHDTEMCAPLMMYKNHDDAYELKNLESEMGPYFNHGNGLVVNKAFKLCAMPCD